MNYFLIVAALALAAFAASRNQTVIDAVITELPAFEKFDPLFKQYGLEEGVPWRWLKAFAMNESSLGTHPSVSLGMDDPSNPQSVSDDGLSYGLMQLTLPTANDYESVSFADLNNPETSVRIAARFISHLMAKFSSQKQWVVKAYNEGEGNAAKERAGQIAGKAQEYWDRWQRNLSRVLEKQPGDEMERG